MDNTTSTSPSDDREAFDDSRRRRPYHAPVLTEYGSVAKLTETMFTGSQADGGGGFARRMVCL